jgi:hypothetical protein
MGSTAILSDGGFLPIARIGDEVDPQLGARVNMDREDHGQEDRGFEKPDASYREGTV